MPAVPNVVGMSQANATASLTGAGFTVGAVATASSPTVAAGSVISSSPGAGTNAAAGSAVDLRVSSGPAAVVQVRVPDVTGLTRTAAETALGGAGLTVGPVKNRPSDEVPQGGAVTTEPSAGTPVTPATPITLFLSSGPRFGFMSYLPTVLFSILGITVLWLIGFIVTQSGQVFLIALSNKEVARGLITFLIAIATVGIALILAISTLVITEGPDDDKRFDRGKQVLSVLIGVLGTIVGFYFGSGESTGTRPPTEQRIVTTGLPAGEAGKPYTATAPIETNGLKEPLAWTVTPALPADLQLNAKDGTISGTPKAKSKAKYKFEVTDSATPPVVKNSEQEIEIK